MTTSAPQQVRGPLSAAVARLCANVSPQVSEATAAGLGEVAHRLSAPLQVAVAGRIKSGKSTLVNALIGRRVAPTDVGECTRLVTRFQYGTVDRVDVVLRDGSTRSVPFDADGAIPAELGVDSERVSHLEAYLTSAVLRDLTVVDTPGLGSSNPDAVGRAERFLQGTSSEDDGDGELDSVSRSAVAGAEAVLYVVTQAVRADDKQALETFTAATGNRPAGPVNAVALLNKVDAVEPDSVRGGEGDLWRVATHLAGRQAEALRPCVAEVIPVVGLLAETAETGVFTAADADALHELAELDEVSRRTMLMSADLFTGWECDVPAATRTGLLRRLDLYGIRRALEAIDADPGITAGALRRTLLAASGLSQVTERLEAALRSRSDGIKAAAGLSSVSALAQASTDPVERQRLHDAVEALLAQPQAHEFRLLEALTTVSSGAVALPDDLVDEVIRVGSAPDTAGRLGMAGRSPGEMSEYALERANWWRSFASFGATPAQSRVAHVVHRAYFLLWRQLRDAAAG